MARKGRKKEEKKGERAPPPISGAGLIAFYQEEIHGIKIKPIYVIISCVMLIVTVVLAHLGVLAP